jgi:hypothetical protein
MKYSFPDLSGMKIFFFIFILCIFSIPFATVEIFQLSSVSVRWWECFLILLSPMYFIKSIDLKLLDSKLFFILLLYFFSIVLSLIKSNNNFQIESITQVILFLFFAKLALVTSIFSRRSQITYMIWFITLSALFVSLHGIYEVFASNVNLTYYEYDGLFVNFKKVIFYRAQSFFAEPNEFSQFLNLPFAFLLSIFLLKPRFTFFEFVFVSLGLLLIIYSQFLSLSRGGFASFLVISVCFLIITTFYQFRKPKFKRLYSLFGLAIFFIFIAYFFVGDVMFDYPKVYISRFFPSYGTDPTSIIRLHSYTLSLDKFSSSGNIATGLSYGNIKSLLGASASTSNLFVDTLAEIGIFGLFIFIFLLVYGFLEALKSIKHLINIKDEKIYIISLGVFLSFVGIIFGGITYATHKLNFFWFIYGLIFAISFYTRGNSDNNRR